MKKILTTKIISLVLLAAFTVTPLLPTPVAAAPCEGGANQLTLLPPWYKGLECNAEGSVQLNSGQPDALRNSIIQIVMNVVEALFYIVGYVSLGLIIWGGFKYMLFGDNPSGMEAAKKTIQNAIIGLIISIFAVVIVNVIGGAF